MPSNKKNKTGSRKGKKPTPPTSDNSSGRTPRATPRPPSSSSASVATTPRSSSKRTQNDVKMEMTDKNFAKQGPFRPGERKLKPTAVPAVKTFSHNQNFKLSTDTFPSATLNAEEKAAELVKMDTVKDQTEDEDYFVAVAVGKQCREVKLFKFDQEITSYMAPVRLLASSYGRFVLDAKKRMWCDDQVCTGTGAEVASCLAIDRNNIWTINPAGDLLKNNALVAKKIGFKFLPPLQLVARGDDYWILDSKGSLYGNGKKLRQGPFGADACLALRDQEGEVEAAVGEKVPRPDVVVLTAAGDLYVNGRVEIGGVSGGEKPWGTCGVVAPRGMAVAGQGVYVLGKDGSMFRGTAMVQPPGTYPQPLCVVARRYEPLEDTHLQAFKDRFPPPRTFKLR